MISDNPFQLQQQMRLDSAMTLIYHLNSSVI